jgi:hypothetical protein
VSSFSRGASYTIKLKTGNRCFPMTLPWQRPFYSSHAISPDEIHCIDVTPATDVKIRRQNGEHKDHADVKVVCALACIPKVVCLEALLNRSI